MPNSLIPTQSPEERELQRQLGELATIQSDLAQSELDLATKQTSLRSFETRYLSKIGTRLARLDQIIFSIAEHRAKRSPQDNKLNSDAEKARSRAKASADTVRGLDPDAAKEFHPSEELKKLYRQAARKVHPDLGSSETDRARRDVSMRQLNDAYERGDIEAIRGIIAEFEADPNAIQGEDIAARLIRTIRMIAQVRRRIDQIVVVLQTIEKSDIYQLYMKAEQTRAQGKDLLFSMAEQLDEEIALAMANLGQLTAEKNA